MTLGPVAFAYSAEKRLPVNFLSKKGGAHMRKRFLPYFVSILMVLFIVNAAGAGVEPSPFKPQLNKINSISNVLESINKRLNYLLGTLGKSTGPSPSGISDQLRSMAYQVRELETRIGEIDATFRNDSVALPTEIKESLATVERLTYGIADSAKLGFFKEEMAVSAMHELKATIRAFAGRVAHVVDTPITKIVPLSLIMAQPCDPFQVSAKSGTCTPLLDYEHLQYNLNWLNDSYASTGVKFWIKSTEGYEMPVFANTSANCGAIFEWYQIKSEFNEILSLSLPDDISVSAKDAGEWISYLVNNHSDKSDLIVWLFDRDSLTVRSANKDENGCGIGRSSLTDYPEGHRVLMNANNMYNPANDPPNDFSPNHLVHELGHYFGQLHVWETPPLPPFLTHPTTGEPSAWSDRWDLAYCLNDLGHPFFFSSKSDAQASSEDCGRNGGYRNIVMDPITTTTYTGIKNCTVGNLINETNPVCHGDSVMDCTIASSSFSSYDTALQGLSFPTGDVESCPDLSFAWGVNAMGYWGGAFDAHIWVPGYFSASQSQLIKAYVSAGSRSDRAELGTNNDSFIWWANGDLSFAREKKPVSTRTFIPVVGDFDGDGTDDIFWYQPGTDLDAMWFSNGDRTWAADTSFAAEEVAVPVAGDFDGNGVTDILWYVPRSPTHSIWWFSASTKGYVLRTIEMTPGVLRSYIPVVGKFDGTPGDDILWYDPVGGTTFLWLSDGGSKSFHLKLANYSTPGLNYTPFAGDFNGDGKTDVFWYAKGPTTDKVWWAVGNAYFDSTDSAGIQVQGTYSPIVGDFNGDGYSDILWDAVGHTTDFLWTGSSSGDFEKTTATAYDAFTPIAGKFDRNNTTDIFWYNSN